MMLFFIFLVSDTIGNLRMFYVLIYFPMKGHQAPTWWRFMYMDIISESLCLLMLAERHFEPTLQKQFDVCLIGPSYTLPQKILKRF